MKYLEQKIQGQLRSATVEKIGSTLWVHMDGRTYSYEPPRISPRGAGGPSSSSDPEKIRAPMPGKITKLLLRPGDPVKEAQTLVLMEAMKMEYSLKSEMEGVVREQYVQVGDSVELGQVLVELKPGEEAPC